MDIKVKPCPFCGGRARVIGKRSKGMTDYCISCSKCGARSCSVAVRPWHSNKLVAQCQTAKLWNTRYVKEEPANDGET